MALAKKIIIYILVLVGLAATGALVSASYLLLVPDSTIFGYYYLSGTTLTFEEEYSEGVSSYDTVEIETHGFDVMLYPQINNLTEIEITFENSASGFTNQTIETIDPELGIIDAPIEKFDYKYSYDSNEKTIKIKTIEPSKGLIFYNRAILQIAIPDLDEEKQIIIKTSGGEVTIGKEPGADPEFAKTLEMNTLSIQNTNAAMNIHNFTISQALQITNKSGRVTIEGNVNGDVVLNSKVGSFSFMKNDTTFDISGDLTITADNAAVEAGDVAGNVSQTGTNGLLKLHDVGADLYVSTSNGEVKINKVLKNVSIITKYNTVKIGTIGNAEGSAFNASVNADNGNIEIGTCYYPLDITSDRGNIQVLNAYWDTTINTTYGDVEFNFALDANRLKNVEDSSSYKTLSITTTEGNITATNLRTKSMLKVNASSAAKITADFKEINGTNQVDAGRRESTIKLPVLTHTLNVKTSTGDINVLVGAAFKTSWQSNDYNDISKRYEYSADIYGGSSEDTVTITSTSGKLNVLTID